MTMNCERLRPVNFKGLSPLLRSSQWDQTHTNWKEVNDGSTDPVDAWKYFHHNLILLPASIAVVQPMHHPIKIDPQISSISCSQITTTFVTTPLHTVQNHLSFNHQQDFHWQVLYQLVYPIFTTLAKSAAKLLGYAITPTTWFFHHFLPFSPLSSPQEFSTLHFLVLEESSWKRNMIIKMMIIIYHIKGVLTSSKRWALYVGFTTFSQMALVSWRIFAGCIHNLKPYGISKYSPGHQRHLGEANKTNI